MTKAVYIHIPFCKTICSYCDFCKRFYDEEKVDKYLDALENEIKLKYNGESIETLYIGGGTPSSLSIKNLKKLFSIINIFHLDKLKEFTFECNINDIEQEKSLFLYQNKVNRISIGIETIDKDLLKILNRNHDKEKIISKINLLKNIGFDNINVDLMYAIPNENINILKKDLEFILSLNANHISTYSLIIEPNTNLYIKNVKEIEENVDYNMYNIICSTLEENNYKHYEISNFCKVGYESKHNLTYWNNNEYYGFGLGSTGYINNKRYTNTRSLNNYINGQYVLEENIESINVQMENELMLGLRKIEGVNKNNFLKKYNKKIEDVFDINKLLNKKYLIDNGTNIYINKKYLYVENSILTNFIGGAKNE